MRLSQRFGWRLAVYCLVALLAFLPVRGGPPRDPDFILRIRILDAIEGGPIVVEGELVYTGREPIVVHKSIEIEGLVVEGPPNWDMDPEGDIRGPRSLDGWSHAMRKIEPGQRITERVFLHMGYSNLPPGKARLEFTWPVREFGGYGRQVSPLVQFLDHPLSVLKNGFRTTGPNDWVDGKLLAKPVMVLTVDIPLATAENLAAMRYRFEKELRQPDLAPERTRYIAHCVFETRHKEFTPVILKLLDCPDLQFSPSLLVGQLYRCNPDAKQVDALLLDYVTSPSSLRPTDPFGQWIDGGPQLNSQETLALRATKNAWVAMLTFVAFAKQCPEKWKAELLAEMSLLAELPAAMENVRLLDDPKFAVREKATARLDALEDLAEPAIRAHLKGNSSPEARRRCEQILADLQANKHDFNASTAMWLLESSANAEATAMLKALAKNPPDCRISRKAREILERRGKAGK